MHTARKLWFGSGLLLVLLVAIGLSILLWLKGFESDLVYLTMLQQSLNTAAQEMGLPLQGMGVGALKAHATVHNKVNHKVTMSVISLVVGLLIGGGTALRVSRGILRTEAQVQNSEQQVHLLLNSTAEGIYGIDSDGRCTFSNQACARLLGDADPDSLLGKPMHTLMHHTRLDGTPYPVHACPIYQALDRGEGVHVDDEVLWRADGSSFPAEYWSYPNTSRRTDAGYGSWRWVDGTGAGGRVAPRSYLARSDDAYHGRFCVYCGTVPSGGVAHYSDRGYYRQRINPRRAPAAVWLGRKGPHERRIQPRGVAQ